MKKILLVLFLGCSVSALAQTEGKPYYFSDELKNAISNCTPYTEDLYEKNPDMKEQAGSMMSMFFDRLDLSNAKMLLNIQGPNEDKCRITVKYDYQLPVSQEFECFLSSEAQNKLLTAMNDESTEEKERTFGNNGFSMTMTGREFDLTFAEITNGFCKAIEHELSEDEQKEILHKMMTFSDKFKDSLKNCTPDRDTIEVMGMEVSEVEIKGKEEGGCHVASHGFHIFLNDDELSLSGFDELAELLADEKRAVYRPSYKYQGTLFALNKCDQKRKYKENGMNYGAGNSSISLGENISISQGVDSTYEKGICQILFSLMVERNGKKEDHSLRCDIKVPKISEYINPYSDLIQQYAPKASSSRGNFSFSMGQQNDEVSKADRELLSKMYQDGICKETKSN